MFASIKHNVTEGIWGGDDDSDPSGNPFDFEPVWIEAIVNFWYEQMKDGEWGPGQNQENKQHYCKLGHFHWFFRILTSTLIRLHEGPHLGLLVNTICNASIQHHWSDKNQDETPHNEVLKHSFWEDMVQQLNDLMLLCLGEWQVMVDS